MNADTRQFANRRIWTQILVNRFPVVTIYDGGIRVESPIDSIHFGPLFLVFPT